MRYYVRATGINQLAGGTSRWLRIRGVEQSGPFYTLEVRIWGRQKFVSFRGDEKPDNLEFARGWPGLQPVSFRRVIAAHMKVIT